MEAPVVPTLKTVAPIYLDSHAPAWDLLDRYAEILEAREYGRDIFRDKAEEAMEPLFRDASSDALNVFKEVLPGLKNSMNALRKDLTEQSSRSRLEPRDSAMPAFGSAKSASGGLSDPSGAAPRSESIYHLARMCSLLEASARNTITIEARKAEVLDSWIGTTNESSSEQRNANKTIISLTAVAAVSSVVFPVIAMLS